jgi:hypothetical protein
MIMVFTHQANELSSNKKRLNTKKSYPRAKHTAVVDDILRYRLYCKNLYFATPFVSKNKSIVIYNEDNNDKRIIISSPTS